MINLGPMITLPQRADNLKIVSATRGVAESKKVFDCRTPATGSKPPGRVNLKVAARARAAKVNRLTLFYRYLNSQK
jgi:hypothetical protein